VHAVCAAGYSARVPRRSFTVPTVALTLAVGLALAALAPSGARALGETSLFDVRTVLYDGGHPTPRQSAPRRLAWELRKRTSIEPVLTPSSARLDDPSIFETPFLYWAGDTAFPELSEGEVAGLRRFLTFGGFLVIDDASAGAADPDGFDASIRRELARAMPAHPLAALPADHTVFRTYYLLDRPVGRVEGPDRLEGVTLGERVAVVYSRHDLGGAWARDNLGNWEYPVEPGGDHQRELAIRLGVNLAMYALCLDYKDDQVHAPFIMRRRAGGPP
jgi:hypothetical protein